MRALWTETEAEYHGEFANLERSWSWPKPAQPSIPVLLGAAGHERAMEAIVEDVIYLGTHTKYWVRLNQHRIAIHEQHGRLLLDEQPIRRPAGHRLATAHVAVVSDRA